MNNKEKECIFYRKQKGSEPFCDVVQTLKKDGSGYCEDNSDCYYKQLQTTKQQLEKYQGYEKIEQFFAKHDSSLDKNDKSYMQRCFELEQQLEEANLCNDSVKKIIEAVEEADNKPIDYNNIKDFKEKIKKFYKP